MQMDIPRHYRITARPFSVFSVLSVSSVVNSF